MARKYHYVGPKKIAQRAPTASPGWQIRSPDDVLQWIRETKQNLNACGDVTATFVIHEAGSLRIADRRSEHVACAGSRVVLSAGEITFRLLRGKVAADRVTNQSVGYCPEPESWAAVKSALEDAGL